MILKGKDTVLRAPESADIQTLFQAAKVSDAHKFTTPYWRPLSEVEFEAHVTKSTNPQEGKYSFVIAVDFSDDFIGRPIGLISLKNVHQINRNAEVGITIFASEDRSAGLGTDALNSMCKWAFEQLTLRRLYAKCARFNEASIKLFRRNEFQEEGVWRSHLRIGDEFHDAVLLGRLVD